MAKTLKSIALIPARSGSKRLEHKNIRPLAGHPLVAYTIAAAQSSELFSDIIVSTDSEPYAEAAKYYGAQVPFLRPSELAGDTSPDIEWVAYTLGRLKDEGKAYDCASILRPTSPFRQAETIRRAWSEFMSEKGADSLRAVEKVKQHPGKMWVVSGKRMTPFIKSPDPSRPSHSSQYAALPPVYVQNASLEIAWTRVVFQTHTIAGTQIVPFFTEGLEGFDINDPEDWERAQDMIASRHARLPSISLRPYPALKKIYT